MVRFPMKPRARACGAASSGVLSNSIYSSGGSIVTRFMKSQESILKFIYDGNFLSLKAFLQKQLADRPSAAYFQKAVSEKCGLAAAGSTS